MMSRIVNQLVATVPFGASLFVRSFVRDWEPGTGEQRSDIVMPLCAHAATTGLVSSVVKHANSLFDKDGAENSERMRTDRD